MAQKTNSFSEIFTIVMYKAWHYNGWYYANAVKVSHFEWIKQCIHGNGKVLPNQFHLKQVMIW